MHQYENTSSGDLIRRIAELEDFIAYCAGFEGDGSAREPTYCEIVAEIGAKARELLE